MRTVSVALDKCTLCGACSDVCPTSALTSERVGESIRLLFRDSACSPSLCDSTCLTHCPENAISLDPTVKQKDAEAVLLAEDGLASCSTCGSPYTSSKVKNHMKEILLRKKGTEFAIAALNYCPACRRSKMIDRLEEFARA